jgi:hypothetical protein
VSATALDVTEEEISSALAIANRPDTPAERANAVAHIEMERRFDATRPPCPSWCAGECVPENHFGDAVLHTLDIDVPSTPDQIDAPDGTVTVQTWRIDNLDEPSSAGVTIDVSDAAGLFGESAVLSAAQARRLAAELLNAADRIDQASVGEMDVLATDVKIGDLYQVGGEWLHVYMVSADEASGTADIFTTVDPSCFPECDGDEDPHQFSLTDTVRVRRPRFSGDPLKTGLSRTCSTHE